MSRCRDIGLLHVKLVQLKVLRHFKLTSIEQRKKHKSRLNYACTGIHMICI